ncbi:MAG: HAMP domain-containing protein [Kouleothrix sp.]|nr:HAMP domain-containing protein [Kouleothrix sp.]
MLRKSLPLRTRLALGYTAFFALVLVLLGIGVFLTLRDALLTEMKRELQTSGQLIQQDFDASNAPLAEYFRKPEFLLRTRPPRVEGLEAPSLYVQAITPSGAVIVTSPSLQDQVLPLDEQTRAAALQGPPQFVEAQLSGARVLVLAAPLLADQRIVGVLQVAQPLREIDRTLRLLMISLVSLGAIALLAALRGGSWLARRALLPVGQVAQTARQIVRAEDLAQRVPAASADDELGQLTSTVNEMLERLETLFTAQRRFVADVSHELRTPLAAMRGNLEILRRGAARDPRALDESLAAMEREVNRLVRLASDLLLLAQAEAGVSLRHEPVALDELVLEVVRELAPLAGGVALLPEVAEQVEVIGDRDRIKQALLNMVVNAIQHTAPGGKVRVALARDGRLAHLRAIDTGVGIAAQDLPFVFERFFRVEKARSRAAGGAGLGLAIVKWVAEAHGGAVAADSAPGQGSSFTLSLPLAGPALRAATTGAGHEAPATHTTVDE